MDPFDSMPSGSVILRRLLTGMVVMIGSLTLIGFAITKIGWLDGLRRWDESINVTLASGRSHWASELGESVTAFGATAPILMINAAILIVLALCKKWRAMTFVPMALLIEIVTFLSVNLLVGRPRPTVERLGPLPGTDSYPSGHIAATFVCWMGIAALLHVYGRIGLSRLFAVIAAVCTVAMGWARVYVGMHHVLDVAMGLVMGVAALLLAIFVLGQSSRFDRRARHDRSASRDE